MNRYTYNDVSWRVYGEINQGTVAVKFLNAKEAHRSSLTSFLWHAMGVMSYTTYKEKITYTVAETEVGYTFWMEWRTTLVKAQAIHEYAELLKGPERPTTGNTQWRRSVAHHLERLLSYSSELNVSCTPLGKDEGAKVRLEAMVKFSSLVDAPHIPRLYEDGPQRQVCIFDLFEYQDLQRHQLEMDFQVGDEQQLSVLIRTPSKHFELSLGHPPHAHRNLVRFLQAIRNIIHNTDEKVPLVNVASIRTTRYYDDDYEMPNQGQDDDDEDEPWAARAEVLHTRYVHFRDDGTHCSMDIRNIHGWGKRFHVLIREGADLELEDDWFYRSNGDHLQHPSYKPQPTRAQLEATLELAFTADDHDLRNAVAYSLPALLDPLGPERYQELYGAAPPYALLEQI